MLRRLVRIALTLGLLGGLAFAVSKLLGRRRTAGPESQPIGAPSSWPPLEPEPAPTAAATTALLPDPEAPAAKGTSAWVDPDGDVCPTTHPVKAKLSSKIFHLPGMLNYDRTKPDRCYRDGPAAEGDGLRPAKR